MIQKGRIERVIDKYTYKVRIPKYDKVLEDPEGTRTEDLAEGLVCITPGMNVAYTVGDIVIVSFENDEISKPVILGLLYRDNNENIDSGAALTLVDDNIKQLKSSISGIKNSSSVYTHVRYSNDNGVTFTSLYNPNISERTDSEGNIYCIPVWSTRGLNGIQIDKDSDFLTWFILDENKHNITNQIGIDTIFFDSEGNILRTVPKEDREYTIQLNNLTDIEGALYLTYRIYAPKNYLDKLHISLSSDKNVLGTVEGKYLGLYITNSPEASLDCSDYQWISFASGGMSNDVTEAIAELEETTGDIKEQITEVVTDVDGFRVSVTEAVATSKQAEDMAKAVQDAADRGDFDGVGVYSTVVTYQASSSNTEVPSGTWYDEDHMPEVPDGHYLWTKTYITYTNNTHSTSYSVARQGIKGDTGDTGLNVSNVSLYQRGSTAPSKPTGNLIYSFITGDITLDPEDITSNLNGWTKNIPEIDGHPCWVISTTVSANTSTTIIEDTSWSAQVKFVEDGESGGIGAHGINTAPIYLYQRSSSTPKKPVNTLTYTFSTRAISGTIDNNWVVDIGTLTGTDPIWVIGAVASSNTDSDTIGSNEWSAPIILSQDGNDGSDGQDGSDGISISSVTNYYLATSLSSGVTPSTSGWTTTIQTMDSTNQYLWNYEVVTGSDSSIINTTTPIIIGRYGQDGSQGPSGSDGKGITSITEYYLATSASSDVTPSTSGWTTEVQTTDSTNKYLWNYEVIAYTVGSPYTSEPRIIGTQGEDGQDGQDGIDGINGLNQATVYIYKRSSVIPDTPEESGIYTFATGELTGDVIDIEGWETSVPNGSNPCYVSTALAISRESEATIEAWSDVVKFVENGINGYNQATLNLYQRTSSTLTGSDVPTNTSYNFNTKQISGSIGNWSTSIPNGTAPCWSTSAVAISREQSVSLVWSAPVKIVQNGQDGQSGLNQATINLYKRAASVTAPTISVRYKFSDGTLRNNSDVIIDTLQGWGRNIPTGTEQCWIVSASAISREDYVTISSWSSPIKLVKDGTSATQYYTYVKYATDSSGSNMRDTPMAGYNYIGTYTGTTQTPSANLYTWSKYVGDNGQDGTSVTVTSIEYAVTDTEDEPISWESQIPEVGEDQWLWSKVTLSGSDNVIISKSYSGKSGTDGYNQATINLYQRASSASKPSSTVTYRFSDGKFSTNGTTWSDSVGSWVKSMPAINTSHPEYPCWVISAVAISQDSTDDISTTEWSGPNKCAENGLNQAVIRLYKRASSKPVDTEIRPNRNLTYTFKTSTLSPTDSDGKFNGWSKDIPESDSNKNPCWFISAVASGTGLTDTILTTDWNPPLKLMNDGVGITRVEEEYRLSDREDKLDPETSSVSKYTWSTTQPAYEYGKFYWVRQHIFYDNGSNDYSTPVCDKSINGAINHVETYYLSTASFDVAKDQIQSRVAKTQLELIGQTYALCQTASETSTKEAIITPQDQSWTLQTDTEITVQFEYRNTTNNPKLSINGQPQNGASLKDKDGNTLTEEKLHWEAGSIFLFKYDGTNWRLQDNLKFERLDKAESAITQNANNIELKVSDSDLTGNNVISRINLNSTTATIKAARVQIDGAAIFNNSDFQSLANNAYDENGAANIAKQQAISYTDNKTANMATTTDINQLKANYGTCSTSASTRIKVVTCSNFELVDGNELTVYFSIANTQYSSSVQLNINNKGAKDVWVANAVTSSSNQLLWGAGAYITFKYVTVGSSSYFIVIGEPRSWYGASTTAASTASKTDTTAITGCVICKGAKIELAMSNKNTNDSATLNIRSTGAKAIYYGNTSTRPTVDNGHSWIDSTTATFTFDGSAYRMAGQTVINGDNIVTGSISANELNVNNINASGIFSAGSFNSDAKRNINKRSQRIYYKTNQESTPGTPNSWVSRSDTVTNNWTTCYMSYDNNNPCLFTCIQYESLDGYLTYSEVIEDTTQSDARFYTDGELSFKAASADLIEKQQTLYRRSLIRLNPATIKPSAWVEQQDADGWTTTNPEVRSENDGIYLYTCTQMLTNGGECITSDVVLDESMKGLAFTDGVENRFKSLSSTYTKKSDSIKRTQRIYLRNNDPNQLPAEPSSDSWIEDSEDYNYSPSLGWVNYIPEYNSDFKILWTCEQYELSDNSFGHTPIKVDNTTTVIDGDNITTGTINANRINLAPYMTFENRDYAAVDASGTKPTFGTNTYYIHTTADEYILIEDFYSTTPPGSSGWDTIWNDNWKNCYIKSQTSQTPYLKIGNKDTFAITVDNKQIIFWNENERVAFIDGKLMSIPKSVMLEEMMIGQDKWSWKEHNGNLQLKWLGE